MATSGTISTTPFNTRKVIDTAFRRCRLPVQKISSEMQEAARDALYLLLSNLANDKPPSWCIERVVLPMYRGIPTVPLPIGTVGVLNLNYRTISRASGTNTILPHSLTVRYDEETALTNFGIYWATTATAVTLEASLDGITWTTIANIDEPAVAGEWVWIDITPATDWIFYRATSVGLLVAYDIFFGINPSEIPMGTLNKDQFVQQSNKVFESRPNSYWFQRDIPIPILHLWPAPNTAATTAQLILWRHRHIMDVGTLQQEIEVPQRWMEAIVSALAAKVAEETPEVDAALIPALEAKATAALDKAREGDNDGSPTFYQPYLSPYTR